MSTPTIKIPSAFRELVKPARYKAFFGGRGSGKSHAFATALIAAAVDQPERILCAREIQKSIADSVKRLLDDKIELMGLNWFFKSTDTAIEGSNGSAFIFAGLRTNAQSIKSLEGVTKAWVEEANTVSKASLEILVPTIRAPGSELWFSWNPGLVTDPVDQMFRSKDGPPPNSIVRQVNWNQNKFFPDVLRSEMEWDRKRDPDKWQHIWEGGYRRSSEARVFKNWRIDRLDVPPDARPYYGADWGFSVDPTVVVRCFMFDRTLYIEREAYRVGCEIDDTPRLFESVPGSRKWPITADSARPETISYMRRNGFNIVAAKKGAGSVEDGVEFMRSHDIVVHPDCRHTIDELTHYSWKTDPLTNEVLPVLADAHNHVIDAVRYALEGTRQALGPRIRRF